MCKDSLSDSDSLADASELLDNALSLANPCYIRLPVELVQFRFPEETVSFAAPPQIPGRDSAAVSSACILEILVDMPRNELANHYSRVR
jgi:hypothetical protein